MSMFIDGMIDDIKIEKEPGNSVYYIVTLEFTERKVVSKPFLKVKLRLSLEDLNKIQRELQKL